VSSALNIESIARSVLVADVGGTNARFALASMRNGEIALSHVQHLRVAEHAQFAQALEVYVNSLPPDIKPQQAVLAVATAVCGDQIAFTNSSWTFSIRALQAQFGFQRLQVINDFAAVAWALPWLSANDVRIIGHVNTSLPITQGVYAALGPGTGLGVAGLKLHADYSSVIETEGGHIAFAPSNAFEIEILRWLQTKFARVSCERVLCGPGLLNLYEAHCAVQGISAQHQTPESITQAQQSDQAARKTVLHFCELLGAFAGDVALMMGAWQGVFLAGGLLPHVLDNESSALLRQRFEDKGRFSELLRGIPLYQIARDELGGFGAAGFAFKQDQTIRG
jgi:glucokinase